MKSSEIREKFLNYFESKGHKVMPSSSLVPSDPTVLLTLAGMLQFKPIFLGMEKPKYKRVTTVQKCIRMNDIENVGRTARHHTFFEMLGNFSFGDYFKKDAIVFAWDFLTKELKLPKDRLLAAIFNDDDESFNIWEQNIGIPKERIVRLGEDNNFWAAGPTGPCGPCSEIYYDLGPERGCGKPDCKPGCDCDRFLEVWNLVFIQFNRNEKGILQPLPSKNIDTGMGLERIASILQNVPSNFETDLFIPLISAITEMSKNSDPNSMASKKIVADHARAITHLIADQVIPSNEGRGYVLRRLIRRAVRHGRSIGIKEAFMYKLAQTVSDINGMAYPELIKDIKYITTAIKTEEDHFSNTLEQGMIILDKLIKSGSMVISGKDVFLLHDTYGFPMELTKEIAGESGIKVDEPGFAQLMDKQKDLARTSGISPEIKKYIHDLPDLPATKFEGYSTLISNSKVLHVNNAENIVVLDRTSFYPEAGGQVGDTGKLHLGTKEYEVVSTYGHIGGVIVHKLANTNGIKDKVSVKASVDAVKRKATSAHHTSTHILNAALRELYGKNVVQSGSHVSPEGFRFDFSHYGAISKDDIDKIERRANELIKAKLKVELNELPIEEAKKMGALMFFGDKYGEKVRMIRVGDFSLELCGGTHVKNTSEISFFKIVSETSISSGIRRIEAKSADAARKYVIGLGCHEWEKNKLMFGKYEALELKHEFLEGKPETYYQFFRINSEELDSLTKAANQSNVFLINRMLEDFRKKNTGLAARIDELKIDLEAENIAFVSSNLEQFIKGAVDIGATKVFRCEFRHYTSETMRKIADMLKLKMPSFAAFLFSMHSEKINLIIALSDDLTAKLDAGQLAKIASKEMGGGGGGKKNIAEAGGKDPSKIPAVFDKMVEEIKSKL